MSIAEKDLHLTVSITFLTKVTKKVEVDQAAHMTRRPVWKHLLALAGLLLCPRALPQEPHQIPSQQASRSKAWDILRAGPRVANFDKPANAIQPLALPLSNPAPVH